MNYLARWAQDICSQSFLVLREGVRVEGTGKEDVHTGPSWRYAKVAVFAEPAQEFSVSFDLPPTDVAALQADGWLDEVIFGVLDVLTTSESCPILGIALHITKADYDPISSSRIAFRMAGRRAARDMLSILTASEQWVICPRLA